MEFSYNTYLVTTLIIPLCIILAMLLILGFSLSSLFQKAITKTIVTQDIWSCVFCVILVVVLIIPQARYLMNGGRYMLTERENDAIWCSGIVEDICSPSMQFPRYKSSHRYGADVVIDGKRYFIIDGGSISNGDFVSISYLPKSHFILNISVTK